MNRRAAIEDHPLSDYLPLREPTFYILLSLASGQKHGYAILKEVEAISEGRLLLSTGTLYEALSRLVELGLVERSEAEAAVEEAHPGRPRKLYALTDLGRRVLAAETQRLETLAGAARLRLKEGGST